MLNYNKSFRESTGKSARKSIYSGNKLHTTSMNLKVSNDAVNQFIGLPLKEIIYNKREDQRNRNYNANQNHNLNHKDQQKIKMSKKTSKYTNINKTHQDSAMKKSINASANKNVNQNIHPNPNNQQYQQQQHRNHYDQTAAKILQTQRFNRQTGTYRRSIEIFKPKQQRLKTDINQQIIESTSKRKIHHQKNRSQLSPSPFKKNIQNYNYPNTNRLIYHQTGSTNKNQRNDKNQILIQHYNPNSNNLTNHHTRNDIVQIKADELKSLLNAVKSLKKEKERLIDQLKFYKKSSNKESSVINAVMKALAA